MDLFKDISKGKKFTKKGLKKEAKHELKELGGKRKAEALEKAIEKKKESKNLSHKGFSSLHKKKTGYHLEDEEIEGEV